MAKMGCACGAVFRFGEGSLPGEHVLIPDDALVKIIEELPDSVSPGAVVERLDTASRMVLFCQNCDRVYVERRIAGRFVVYRVEGEAAGS
ncbi:MAG: hypothetical protein KC766_05895 [Myxococcales bacterium]|nr:hypothetical protein [Myxococcales bacterium]